MNNLACDFAIDLLARTVRRKDNAKPVDRATAANWVAALRDADHRDRKTRDAFEKAVEKVLNRKYGGQEGFYRRAAPLVVGVAGVYLSELFIHRTFDYTLVVPGPVVATNGTLVDDNRVRWVFDARRAWPLGFEMACRSLEPAAAALQQRLLGRKPLATRQAMIDFVDIVRNDAKLVEVMKECRRRESVEPLRDLRSARIAEGNDAAAVRTLDRLFDLLELPKAP
jgi:hypothetical protein